MYLRNISGISQVHHIYPRYISLCICIFQVHHRYILEISWMHLGISKAYLRHILCKSNENLWPISEMTQAYLKPYLRYISSITQVHHFQISISIASQPFSCLFIFRKRQKVSIQSNHVFKITSCLFSCQTHQQLRLRLVYH